LLTRSVLVARATSFGTPRQLGDLLEQELVAGADALVARQADADDVDARPTVS
jgi:hypothetical protein